MESWIVASVTVLACAMVTGLVASIEAALVGLPQSRIKQAVHEKLRGARTLATVMERQALIWAALQLVRLGSVLIAGAAVLGLAQSLYLTVTSAIAVGAAAALLLLVAYLVPRSLARRHALAWARATIEPVRVLTLIAFPVVAPLVWLANYLSKLLRGAPSPFWTADELMEIHSRAKSEGLGHQRELLDSMIEFSDTVIREIMVPRTHMIGIPLDHTPEEIRQVLIEQGHSRIPVYSDTIDNIVGLLHVKDLLKEVWGNGGERREDAGSEIDIRRLLRPTFYVPEVMKISELLRDFQRRKTHMAIVVDEYGGTAGVVTLEDIIEEIVGEIQDEYDIEEKQFRVIGENKIIADGRVQVYDLEEVLGVQFPEDGGFETLAGFLMYKVGYVPEPGAVITWNNLRFTVKEANEKRIATVEIERPPLRESVGPG